MVLTKYKCRREKCINRIFTACPSLNLNNRKDEGQPIPFDINYPRYLMHYKSKDEEICFSSLNCETNREMPLSISHTHEI